MENYNFSQYSDLSEAIKLTNKKYDTLRSRAVFATLDYSNKITNKFNDDELFKSRDSILFRLESILYHYDLLNQSHISGSAVFTQRIDPSIGQTLAINQGFLFDSIVFHAMSFFDYISCFVYKIVFNEYKKQWSSLAKKSRQEITFKTFKLATVIDNSDRSLVNRLNNYRSILIHYSDDKQPFGQSFDLLRSTATINVYCPDRFRKEFRNFLKGVEESNLHINNVALWLINNVIQHAIEIFDGLSGYIELNRKVEKGQEFIQSLNRTK